MPSVEETAYPRLNSNPNQQALKTIYTPTKDEIALAQRSTRGKTAVLGFLILLKTFQTVGYPVKISQVPKAIVTQIATTIGSSLSANELTSYDASGTRRRHITVVRKHLNIQAFGPAARKVMTAAIEVVVQTQHDLVDLINVALEELVRKRFEIPGFTTLLKAANNIRATSNESIYKSIFQALDAEAQMRINQLFYRPDDERTTPWYDVKQEPGKPNLGELQRLVERLHWLKPFQISNPVLTDLAEVKQMHFATEGQALGANQMKELPEPKRYTLAAALLKQRYSQTLDDIAEVFI